MMPSDLEFIVDFVKNIIDGDLYNKALAYCISLIVLHPFKNGNHRTSIYAAEMFLIENGYDFLGNVESHRELQKWRFGYEEAHDMEARFARIMAHDNHRVFIKEIKTVMDEEYGKEILNWLKQNYE